MAERAVHLSIRGLLNGVAPGQGSPGSVAAPGQRTRVGPFEFTLEAARPRILPGEENNLILAWTGGDAGEADLQIVLDLPAEVSAPEAKRSARITLGKEAGELVVPLMGQEPGGVWIDALLTLEDEMGVILGRAKAGFAVARHRVVISEVQVEPPVAAAGDAFKVKANYVWTGAARMRGTIGGSLRRRSDGHTIELHREKVSALGERTQEWTAKAPIDQLVADFDVELTFEGKESQARAQFGKTGVLAVRRGQDAEVASLAAAPPRVGEGEKVLAKALLRNTGVRHLKGNARLDLWERDAGSPDAALVAGIPDPAEVPLDIPPAGAAEASWSFVVPPALEGRRLEGHLKATFGSLVVERREVLIHIVPNHLLEFDGFAADRYAYAPGETAAIECRVRDDGARPGGAFTIVFRLKDENRALAETSVGVKIDALSAPLRAELKLPEDLKSRGPLDLEIAVAEPRALRRVPGFVRVRQVVASRVVIVKPPVAHGLEAFLFEAETVARDVALGEVEGVGGCRLAIVDSGAFFVVAPGEVPLVEPREGVERAMSKALVELAGAPPPPSDEKAWGAVIDALSSAEKAGGPAAPDSPAGLVAKLLKGATFGELAESTKGAVSTALELSAATFSGQRLPATEIANQWVTAAEKSPSAGARGEPLRAVRHFEAEQGARLKRVGLTRAGLAALAQAAVLRRAVEAQIIGAALLGGAPDQVLSLSVSLKQAEERLRSALRYYSRFLAKMDDAQGAATDEGRTRRKLASLRAAQVELKGADQILPGRYNAVEVRVRLPAGSPAGGMVSAAVALPSELWIVGSETANLLRGQYLLPALPLEPGSAAGWKLDLYVPDRAGGEPGAIEIRLGFDADEESAQEVEPA